MNVVSRYPPICTVIVFFVAVISVASNTPCQDLIFADSFEWGSICAWSNHWYPDGDQDGFGNESAAGFEVACPPPDHSAANNTDCMDSDPLVNPGALEIATGGIDDDCDGETDEIDTFCPEPFPIADLDPMHAAEAIGLCQTTSFGNSRWGVLNARYVRANGDPVVITTPSVGILPTFGANVAPRQGDRFLALSSGHARDESQANSCGENSCHTLGPGTPPPGFPQDVPGCQGGVTIFDDIGFELTIRAPTNATGLSFYFNFFSFEWPSWVCTAFNDQFIALVEPAPPSSITGNIAIDQYGNPVGVNFAYFPVCDSLGIDDFAVNCHMGCPSPPDPYCPLGPAELESTGFLTWDPPSDFGGGATSWVKVTAPVVPGEDFSIRFSIWDTGDAGFDSTVLIDEFGWVLLP